MGCSHAVSGRRGGDYWILPERTKKEYESMTLFIIVNKGGFETGVRFQAERNMGFPS